MGQIAEDIINGFCCSLCGTYFEEEHGYPVLCHHCWEQAKEEGRVKRVDKDFEMTEEGFQKAHLDEL